MAGKPNPAAGRGYLAIPGPSVIPEAVLNAMHRPAPNIYAGELPDMMPGITEDLKKVARTKHDVAIYIGNGHAAWEAALANVIEPGDQVLVPRTGHFSWGWGDTAEGLGGEVVKVDTALGQPMDMARITQALVEDSAQRIKAVLAVHVDTSTSLRNDIVALRAAMDAAGHPALLMVDCIASLACDVFEMDGWGVDVMVTGSQKGLMVPPGMSFVFFNDKAAAVREKMTRVSRYWDWTPRASPGMFMHYWHGTAPTHHVYGLRTALDMIHAEGIENIWARHEVFARAIWAACDAWGQRGNLRMTVRDPARRSHSVTGLQLESPQATALREWTEAHLGLTLGIGLGMAPAGDPAWHGYFRLGHMGHVNGHMIMGLLGGIQSGMAALGLEHGRGALDAASEIIAES
ncbi:pyridoxal-phosphate-dependent aminotransferase family protein [Roseobacter ponti]|uniref:Alanine--glyoxylate aminotransferase family protein n=1 Tax=Roseobacter ponti TaxID=1891787 RepID=A0A858SPB5_9RHOB|nr:aminotransferase class V-fold PLP-dependent enzyme [Roseobacter ponti]QJF50624.1 alanine--glyoxylate aminotransferase family protein [Roseobacter ponti]